jgi:hypothetical protein
MPRNNDDRGSIISNEMHPRRHLNVHYYAGVAAGEVGKPVRTSFSAPLKRGSPRLRQLGNGSARSNPSFWAFGRTAATTYVDDRNVSFREIIRV